MSITKGIVSPIFKQNLVSSIVRSILNIDEFPPEFSPLSLFSNNEQGLWYDPSDLTTLFQDAAGTIPVTADGDPVGLMLDKSQGLELGPDTATNGGFDTDIGWVKEASWTISGGVAVGNGTGRMLQSFAPSISVGSVVEITYTIVTLNSGSVRIDAGNGSPGTPRAAPGTYSERLGVVGTLNLYINQIGRAFDGTIDNISVREIKGNHATQSVAASRPVYQRGDSRGVVNLLKWSEAFDNAVWNKLNCTVTSGQADPGGGSTAWSITDDATDGTHLVRVNATPGSESTMRTYTVTVKGGTARYVLFGRVSSGVSGGILVFDTQTGTFSDTGSALIYDQVFTPVDKGNGWWEIGFNSDSNSILSTQFLVGISSGPTHETDWSYIGSGDDIYIWHPQMELGTTTTPYQRNDSHLGGVATGADTDLHWLFDDKIDDVMTATLPAMPTATVATATDDGVVVNYPVNIPAGAYSVDTTSTQGFDYGRVIVDRQLTAPEQTTLTTYLEDKS